MGFREDILVTDLIAALPEQARVALGGHQDVPKERHVDLPATTGAKDVIFFTPLQSGGEIKMRSSCLELEPWPSMCYDVNGYYCELGVGYRATRKQLLRAYLERDGQSDERLTYVFSQLLDPKIRREYDACQPDEVFFDRYVIEGIRRKADEQSRQLRTMGIEVSTEDLLDKWGFDFDSPGVVQEQDQAEERVDTPKESRETVGVPPETPPQDPWPYAYFLWRLQHRDRALDLKQMARLWQEAIITECEARRVSTSFAVGIMRDEVSRISELSVKGVRVIFIDISAVSNARELAIQAVNRLIS